MAKGRRCQLMKIENDTFGTFLQYKRNKTPWDALLLYFLLRFDNNKNNR